MENSRQEKIIDMMKDFLELSKEDQVYVSGIIRGIKIRKEFNLGEQEKASA